MTTWSRATASSAESIVSRSRALGAPRRDPRSLCAGARSRPGRRVRAPVRPWPMIRVPERRCRSGRPPVRRIVAPGASRTRSAWWACQIPLTRLIGEGVGVPETSSVQAELDPAKTAISTKYDNNQHDADAAEDDPGLRHAVAALAVPPMFLIWLRAMSPKTMARIEPTPQNSQPTSPRINEAMAKPLVPAGA